MSNRVSKTHHRQLLDWYRSAKRELPWRAQKDPYRIWISEVMLQQTTVAAVVPYFHRFMDRFPHVQSLANASIESVYELWTGLGYYSRARNLHKAAQQIALKGFPKTKAELLELPGLGPYTASAVASIAFDEPVGVLDGNVIRVLSRLYNIDSQWWNSAERNQLQKLADSFAELGEPSEINQALMELGATICTPKKTLCVSCPWVKTCAAYKADLVQLRPRPRPRKKMEVWIWEPHILIKNKKIALTKNDYAPFLRGAFIFPGEVKKAKTKPEKFAAKHTITHHEIFVIPQKKPKPPRTQKIEWVQIQNLSQKNPSILLKKVITKVQL